MSTPVRAPLGSALALLLALCSLAGPSAPVMMAALAVVLILMLAAGWPALLELPSPVGTRIVVGATGLAGVVVSVLPFGRTSPGVALASVCGLGVIGAFVHQMTRHDRDRLTASLTGTVAGSMLACLAPWWLIALGPDAGAGDPTRRWVVSLVALVLAVSLAVLEMPVEGRWATPLALVAGIGAAVIAGVEGPVPLLASAVVAATASVGAVASSVLLSSLLTARSGLAALAASAAPIATVGVIAGLAARILV